MADVLTQHNNNARTGINEAETDEAVRTFGRLRKLAEIEVDPAFVGGPTAWLSQIAALSRNSRASLSWPRWWWVMARKSQSQVWPPPERLVLLLAFSNSTTASSKRPAR